MPAKCHREAIGEGMIPHILGVGVLRSHRVGAQSNRYLAIDIHVAELPQSYVEATTLA